MKEMSAEERDMVYRLRVATGKRMTTCLFCLRLHRGNYNKALELCSAQPDAEGGRLSAAA